MTQILIKRTGTAGQVPEASKLVQGELCLNYGDGRVFFKNGSNTVQDIGYIKTKGDVSKYKVEGKTAGLWGHACKHLNQIDWPFVQNVVKQVKQTLIQYV